MKKTLVFALIFCFAAALFIYGCGTQGGETTTTTTSTTTTTIADNPVYSSGIGTVEGTCTFDLDAGVQTTSEADPTDMYWSIMTMTPLDATLYARNSAKFYVAGAVDFDTTTYEVVSTATITFEALDDSEIPNNTVVFARTSAGRYSKFKILDHAYNMTIQWKTYE